MILPLVDASERLKAEAIRSIGYALRALMEHQPPVFDVAAHGLTMALEHVRTLRQMAEAESKAKAQPTGPRAEGQRA